VGEIPREEDCARVVALLRRHPVVALLGARQIGKTTLAGAVARRTRGPVERYDLEDPADLARLAEPMLALRPLRGLCVLDEIQRRPELFPALRVLADRRPLPARFLVLGSASPELLRQTSETLAGRVAFHELGGLSLADVGAAHLGRLWLRGGFPRSYLARSDQHSAEWRRAFVRTFVERDLAQLGIGVPAATMHRFWAMLAHYHGQVLNASELGRSLEVSDASVRRYLDALCATFVVRRLAPFHENVSKRQVKSPKIYLTDSGLLHSLLGLTRQREVERHPKLGASWEGFVLHELVRRLGVVPEECFFWATHAGAELDLLVLRGGRRHGYEIKRTDAPRLTPSMRSAMETLRLDDLTVAHAGAASFSLGEGVRAIAAARLLTDVKPLP
jgi:predicted AAA+ superfamily ATPase